MGYSVRRGYAFAVIAALALSLGACQNPNAPQSQPGGGPPVAAQPAPVDYERNISMYREAVKVDPGNLNAWTGLGNNAMDAGRFQEAVEAYGKALEIDPTNVNVRVDMGTCYRNLGNPERAADEYRKGLEYDPNHVNGNLNLGVVLFHDLNDYPGALKAWEKFLELAPGHPHADAIRSQMSKIRATMPAKG